MDVLHFNEIAETIKKMILEQAGLNLSQTRILLFFDETENDSLTMGELAKGLNISLSTLSRQLQQKKTKEPLDVVRSETDSSKLVHLNEAGVLKASELKQLLSSIHDKIYALWSEEETKAFLTHMDSVLNELNKETIQ